MTTEKKTEATIADLAKITATTESPLAVRALVAYRECMESHPGKPCTLKEILAHKLFSSWGNSTQTQHDRLLGQYFDAAVEAGWAPAKTGRRGGGGSASGTRKPTGSLSRAEESVLSIVEGFQQKLGKSLEETVSFVQSPEGAIVLEAFLGTERATRVAQGIPAIMAGARVDAGESGLKTHLETVLQQQATRGAVKIAAFTHKGQKHFVAPMATITWDHQGRATVTVTRYDAPVPVPDADAGKEEAK